MDAPITPELEQRLEALAVKTGQTPQALFNQAMGTYLDDLEDKLNTVTQAEQEADRDGWLTTDEVFADLHRSLRKTA